MAPLTYYSIYPSFCYANLIGLDIKFYDNSPIAKTQARISLFLLLFIALNMKAAADLGYVLTIYVYITHRFYLQRPDQRFRSYQKSKSHKNISSKQNWHYKCKTKI